MAQEQLDLTLRIQADAQAYEAQINSPIHIKSYFFHAEASTQQGGLNYAFTHKGTKPTTRSTPFGAQIIFNSISPVDQQRQPFKFEPPQQSQAEQRNTILQGIAHAAHALLHLGATSMTIRSEQFLQK